MLPAVPKHESYLQPEQKNFSSTPNINVHIVSAFSVDAGAGRGGELLDLVPAVGVVEEGHVLVARRAAAWHVVPGLGGGQSAAQAQIGEGQLVVGEHTRARTTAVFKQHHFIRVVAEAKVSHLQREHVDSGNC